MSSTVPAALDTAALEERLKPRILVGNAGDFEQNPQVAGRFFPVAAGGEIVITDILDYPWIKNAAGKRVRNWEVKEATMPALKVAQAIVAPDNFGPKGLYVKVGDPAMDEQSRQYARARWVAWQTDYCLGIESTWIAKVAAHHAANPGSAPPRQPRLVRIGLSWLAQNHDEEKNADRKAFICLTCASEFDTENGPDGLNAHITVRHPGMARDISVAVASAPGPAPQEEDVYDPSVFLAKARELKVKLPKEELEGLIEGDAAVVKTVTAKLATAQAAADKEVARG